MPQDTAQILDYFARHQDEIAGWRRDMHRHPELAFNERWTSDFIAARLESFGYKVARGLGGTGVVATLPGPGTAAIGLRADMDALPMEERNTFEHRSRHAGCMHACGHDGHSAMLLAAARYLSTQHDLPGTVHFVFQPAEEGEGGADSMIRDGLFEQFPMSAIYGLHNWPGLEEGFVTARVGPQMAAFDTFEIVVRGRGAHGAMPHQGRDSIVAASTLALQLQTIVSRSIDPLETAVVSMTQIHGGDAWNVLPEEVVLRGTTRHLTAQVQDTIEARMREVCAGVAQSFGIEVELKYQRRYPSTVNSADETAVALRAAARTVGPARVADNHPPSMASEDFGFMLQSRPGCYAWLGAGDTSGGKVLHSPVYDFNDRLLAIGAAYWVNVAYEGLAAAV